MGQANRYVEATQPWSLAKAAGGDAAAAARLAGVLGDLVEACRVISLAAAPFMPETAAARPSSSASTTPTRGRQRRAAARRAGRPGVPLPPVAAIGVTAPLFPRLEVDETGGTAEPS